MIIHKNVYTVIPVNNLWNTKNPYKLIFTLKYCIRLKDAIILIDGLLLNVHH